MLVLVPEVAVPVVLLNVVLLGSLSGSVVVLVPDVAVPIALLNAMPLDKLSVLAVVLVPVAAVPDLEGHLWELAEILHVPVELGFDLVHEAGVSFRARDSDGIANLQFLGGVTTADNGMTFNLRAIMAA